LVEDHPVNQRVVLKMLERLGYRVDFPEDQTCCGQPAFNSGYRAEARAVARHFLKVFEASECIVVPSGSCTAMVSHHFAELFQKEPETLERVHALEKRVFEFSTFLTDVAKVDDGRAWTTWSHSILGSGGHQARAAAPTGSCATWAREMQPAKVLRIRRRFVKLPAFGRLAD
jgi:CheY-like chemotaxis protein